MPWSIERDGRVAVVTMNTNKANAQNETFFQDLHDALDRLESDHHDSPMVLTGVGEIFSAGIDFNYTFPLLARSDPEEIADWFDRYRATNLRLFTYHRPVITAINGHAIAGGLVTALAGDFRICADDELKIGLNEVPVGIAMPSVYVELVRYACGNHATALSLLFGELYAPEQALQLGFVHQLVGAEKLLATAVKRADSIPDAALDAFAGSKQSLLLPVLKRIDTISLGADRQLMANLASSRTKSANAQALAEMTSKKR